jgi:2-(1,2-epoxy-1,2-dihydrophenyl)acetyl-CoA isomerase
MTVPVDPNPVVLLDRPAPDVARLLINRPDKRNAIDHAVRQELTAAITSIGDDASVRALVFGGTSGVFSAGGDVPSMLGLDEAAARARMQHIAVLCRMVAALRIPVVSAVEGIGAGAAVGLALLGDHIVVGEGTRILFPFLKLGLVPDWGQMLTLPRRVGVREARRILTAGEPVRGEEAHRIGLADAMVADEQVMACAIAKASELAQLPMGAFARMKDRLTRVSSSLDAELQREEDDQALSLTGDEFREGYDAFRNKRAADFIGMPGAKA